MLLLFSSEWVLKCLSLLYGNYSYTYFDGIKILNCIFISYQLRSLWKFMELY